MSRHILISNNVPFHHDIVISVIEKYDFLLKTNKADTDILDVHLSKSNFDIKTDLNLKGLVDYISNTYSHVNVLFGEIDESVYTHKIYCSLIAESAKETDGNMSLSSVVNDETVAYISHDITDYFLKFKNIYYLSKFNRQDVPDSNVFIIDKMPKTENKLKSKKEFVILGSFTRAKFDNTRDFSILEKILSVEYSTDFVINIIGSWHQEGFNLWDFINKDLIHPSNIEKINLCLNQDWSMFNFIVSNSDFIIPLLSKDKQGIYFNEKATSSSFYINSYNLKSFAEEGFDLAYGLSNDTCITYNLSNITKKFAECLEKSYE